MEGSLSLNLGPRAEPYGAPPASGWRPMRGNLVRYWFPRQMPQARFVASSATRLVTFRQCNALGSTAGRGVLSLAEAQTSQVAQHRRRLLAERREGPEQAKRHRHDNRAGGGRERRARQPDERQ